MFIITYIYSKILEGAEAHPTPSLWPKRERIIIASTPIPIASVVFTIDS